MIVVLQPVNTNEWAGVINYRNCHTDLCPYLQKNGSLYTGFKKGVDEDDKALARISKFMNTDLSQNSEFWKTFFIRVTDEDIMLDLNDTYDELKYHFLKNHMDVKNSPSERKAGARWVLVNADEEAKKANLGNRVKREVYAELNKMTVQDMRDAVRLYGERSEDMSGEVVESKLTEYIDRNPERFKELWIDNKARKTQVLLERAVQKGIIRKSGQRFLYGTTDMGSGIHAAIAWLDNIENQDIKASVLGAMKESK